MKFKNVQVENALALIPQWIADPISLARALDRLFDGYITQRGPIPRWDRSLPFSAELACSSYGYQLRLVEYPIPIAGSQNAHQLRLVEYPIPIAGSQNAHGKFIATAESPLGGPCVINLPLNPLLKRAAPVNNLYCVYQHVINTETPLAYIGVTRQRWFDRLSQHARDASNGSPYLFHAAIRQHPLVQKGHIVLLVELEQKQAMDFEEEFVKAMTLYPLGLNMIPGGYAGIKYLGNLGIAVRTPSERDHEVARLLGMNIVDGRANPLCAARWAADQDYVNRVICGHSGRLTTNQVLSIRRLSHLGLSQEGISVSAGVPRHKVISVVNGRRYGRVQ